MNALAYSRFSWDTVMDIIHAAQHYHLGQVTLTCSRQLEKELYIAINSKFALTSGVCYGDFPRDAIKANGISHMGVIINIVPANDCFIDGIVTAPDGCKVLELFRFSPN